MTFIPLFIFPWFINVPSFIFIGIWFVLQFLNGVVAQRAATGGGVAYWAHVGGFLCGLLLVGLFAGRPKSRQAYPDEYYSS
jgi:membrane associated rhomboid family serine protease